MSFFPLPRELMEESQEFRALTPVEKVYYWMLMSRFNAGGPFYRADLEYAVILRRSVDTIRRARRKFEALGWIQIKRGTKDARGRGLATRYLYVKWANTDEASYWAPMPRHMFEWDMVYFVFTGQFEPEDVVTYVYLTYWYEKHRQTFERDGCFYISRAQLRELTGLPDAPEHVQRLYDRFQFSNGDHLFDFTGYQRFKFTAWRITISPEENEHNRQNNERRRQQVQSAIRLARGRQAISQNKRRLRRAS